ncbi:MAG: NAD-dependent epimerase/dehydratase family protein [Gemmatimonadota bacterium]
MAERALITGGAGFIGSHLADALLARGWEVRVLDNLDAQVHVRGAAGAREADGWPGYLSREAERVAGDVRDRSCVRSALEGVDVVFHEAAAVGVGQSMYEIERYVDVNGRGAAVLLEAVLERRDRIRKLVVASSMSVYGEGAYGCPACGPVEAEERPRARMHARLWEMPCPACGADCLPRPTSETKPLRPASVYAVTKRDQEELFLSVGRAYGIPTVALRYFNVYGPRQALGNPYTGVATIFATRLLNGGAPLVFEDGRQTRDFVHVSDVVQANLLALESAAADGRVVNVGTGRAVSVLEVASTLSERLDSDRPAEIAQRFREGDIRHCVADVSRARELLDYVPRVSLADGLADLCPWLVQGFEEARAADRLAHATSELETRGLAW